MLSVEDGLTEGAHDADGCGARGHGLGRGCRGVLRARLDGRVARLARDGGGGPVVSRCGRAQAGRRRAARGDAPLLHRATQGHPGKYTCCIADLAEAHPGPPLPVDRGLRREASAVTVYASEAPHNVLSHYGESAEAVIVAIADTMASLGSFSPGESFVVLAPEHVQILARDGWTKPRIREGLYASARRTRADLKRGGKLAGAVGARYRLREIVVVQKPSASRVAEDAVLDRLARDCDAVVTAIGD